MFRRLMVWLLKKAYRKTMLSIVVLDKSNCSFYARLEPFCTLEVETDHGPFLFQFKEDRRKKHRRHKRERLVISTYIVELIPPKDLVPVTFDLSSKFVLVVKVLLLKPNYEILTQVLMDIYLDRMLNENKANTEVP